MQFWKYFRKPIQSTARISLVWESVIHIPVFFLVPFQKLVSEHLVTHSSLQYCHSKQNTRSVETAYIRTGLSFL